MNLRRWGAGVFAVIAASLLSTGCSSNAPPAMPKALADQVAKTPHAFEGRCAIGWTGDGWRQNSRRRDISDGSASTCVNIVIRIAGPTYPYLSTVRDNPIRVSLWTPRDEKDYYGEITVTDKAWVKAAQQTNGDWLFTWGAKPGETVEWVAAHLWPVPRGDSGFPSVSVESGRYHWHTDNSDKSMPSMEIGGNVVDATGHANPPGMCFGSC